MRCSNSVCTQKPPVNFVKACDWACKVSDLRYLRNCGDVLVFGCTLSVETFQQFADIWVDRSREASDSFGVSTSVYLHPLRNFLKNKGRDMDRIRASFYTHFFSHFEGSSVVPHFIQIFFGVVRAAFYGDVHLLGDSHVQRHRFPLCGDHRPPENCNFPTSWIPGSYFIVAEAAITKKNIHHQHHATPYHTISYPTHPIKTQPIQLGVILKVHVRVFNCQGRRVSTSDPAKVLFWVWDSFFLAIDLATDFNMRPLRKIHGVRERFAKLLFLFAKNDEEWPFQDKEI